MIPERETMNTLMTLTMMVFLNGIKTTGECPRSCECKWKSGKESVLCVNANMTEIPRYLDTGTQLLDLTGNRIQKIGADEFFNASLLNLQKIFLSRCKLRFLDRSSFRKIINLVELDLSYNELHSVPSHTFEFITELRELRLNGNPIVRVLNYSFKMVPRLTKLDLSECRIGYVEIKAFHGLETSLEWLKLDKNKITNIKALALINLDNVHGLELSGNPWNCSCGLRTLREWMLRRNVPYNIPPICKHPPRLSGKIWDKLSLDEFACVPRIEALTSLKNGEEGTNVTLACTVEGNPEPRVRWLRRNHIINNVTELPGGKQKLYIVGVGKETSNLTIVEAEAQDNGLYVCRAENKAGKSEANITVTVTMKPPVKIWSSRMIVAVGVVSLLFATAVGLLTFCAWGFRKRKSNVRHTGTRRELVDGYEMNNKKSISYDKMLQYGNHCSPNSTSNQCRIPGGRNTRESYQNDSSERIDANDQGKSDFGTRLSASGSGSGLTGKSDSRTTWRGGSDDVEDRLSETSNSRASPVDLHIPQLNGHESCRKETSYGTDPSLASSSFVYKMAPSGFLTGKSRPETRTILHGNGVVNVSGQKTVWKKFPDLLELSRNEENLLNNNNPFGTVPRKKSFKMAAVTTTASRTRHGSFGSESQSPLLPGSSGDSCDSNYSTSRRQSIESSLKNASVPTSPTNASSTPIMNLLESSPAEGMTSSPTTAALEYKSWELEKFLTEYRHLQDELYKMKESCENLKEDNLLFRECDEGETSTERSTVSTSVEPYYEKFVDDANNFENLFNPSSGFLEEDNNNPKSILKNKPQSEESQTFPTGLDMPKDTYWSQTNNYLNPLSEPNPGKQYFES